MKITFLGLLPPPLDGQRIVTRMMLDQMTRIASVASYDLHPGPGGATRIAGLEKLAWTLRSLPFVCAQRLAGSRRLYLAPYSGHGILYACVIGALARLLGFRIFVHCHSSRHLAQFSWPMAAFAWICGADAVHIALAPQMAAAFRRLYGRRKRVFVLSNSAFFDPRPAAASGRGHAPLRVGHLSNLCKSKGIDAVLDCARRLEERGADVEMVLAGPMDEAARPAIEAALATLARLRYLGPLAPAEVKRFYGDIDVFLFPTRHPHEAEPLVIIDALAAGVPVIATNRGYIEHLLEGASGCLALSADAFVDRAVAQVESWAGDRDELALASRRAQERMKQLRHEARSQLARLLEDICGTPASAVPAARKPAASDAARASSRRGDSLPRA